MHLIARGSVNRMINCNEDRISREVYDLYCFLRTHSTISEAPNRLKDILRASVNYTPFGYIFDGLISQSAADQIDRVLAAGDGSDPCAGMERDHFCTWKQTADYLLSRPILAFSEFWFELKRRNEIVLLLKTEHSKVGGQQRRGHGCNAYALAGVQLLRIDKRAIKLAGNRAGLVRAYWPVVAERVSVTLSNDQNHNS